MVREEEGKKIETFALCALYVFRYYDDTYAKYAVCLCSARPNAFQVHLVFWNSFLKQVVLNVICIEAAINNCAFIRQSYMRRANRFKCYIIAQRFIGSMYYDFFVSFSLFCNVLVLSTRVVPVA
jgi:hypothetical protein